MNHEGIIDLADKMMADNRVTTEEKIETLRDVKDKLDIYPMIKFMTSSEELEEIVKTSEYIQSLILELKGISMRRQT